jgi:rod shape-determining protein MreD
MKPTLWQRLDVLARRMAPVLMTLCLTIVNVMPSYLPGFARMAPVLPLMAVYHWTVYAPGLMPAHMVFVAGLLFDLLSGAPLGVNALTFLLVYGVVLSQRRFIAGKSFLIVWLGFALVALGAAVVYWALTSVIHVTLLDPGAFAAQYAIMVGLFPLLGWLLLRVQNAFLSAE